MLSIPEEFIETFHQIVRWVIVYDWVLIGIVTAFAIYLLLISKLETNYIQEFEPIAESRLPKLSWYTREMNEQAHKLGFQHCGWYSQKRKGLYQAIISAWLSPDKLTMGAVGGGKLAGIKVKMTYLYSQVPGVTILVTTDACIADSGYVFDKQYLFNANIKELWELHKSRQEVWEGKFERFDASNFLAEYEAIQQRRAEVLIDRGYAKWVDKSKGKWRFTLKGSVLNYIDFRRTLRKAKLQTERFSLRKPGEALGGFDSTGPLARMRDFLMPPSEIVKDAGVEEGHVVLDFGCGDWTCSIAAAKAVGPKGKVYALDILPDVCDEVEKRAKKKRLNNIETIQSSCATGLDDKSVDIVFMHEVLYSLGESKQAVLKELHRVLKDNGILSFSDHHINDKEIMEAVTTQGLFKVLKKGGDLYRFAKATV